MEVTLFKINLDGAQLTANAPFSGGSDGDEPEIKEVGEAFDDDAESNGNRKAAMAAMVGLAFLFVVAVVARKVRGGGDSDEA